MTDRELFLKALDNAIAWQNRCVELQNKCSELNEILEMFCMEAEARGEAWTS